MDYLDFDIEVRGGDGHVYPVSARSQVGEAQSEALFPFTDAELESHLLRLENAILRSAGRRGKALSEEERTVQGLGQRMFEFLLAGELRTLYYLCLGEAERRQQGVRLRLHIRPPLLTTLPWEFLYDPRRGDYVCLDLYTPLVRYLDLAQSTPPLRVTPPLRILGMVASPRDWPALDVEAEKQRVERALHDLRQLGRVEVSWASGQSWRDLQRVMRPGGGPWHIFHFIGHGGMDSTRGEGFVLLSDEQGQSQRISATQLGRLLAGQRYALRLVVLNACEGARGGRADLFASSAAALVRSGLPAVLAMQYAITDLAAVEFAQTFYEALAAGLPVDSAVADARNAVNLRNEYSLEWGTPVLYLRAADGRIFEPMPAAPLPQQETPPPLSPTEPDQIPSSPAPAHTEPEQIPSSIPAANQERTPLPALPAGIRAVLATLYPDEPSARRVVADAGLNPAHIAFSSQATNNWYAILNEASISGQVERVLAVALREYGTNQQLQEAAAAWRAGSGEEPVPASRAAALLPAGEPRLREGAPEPARPATPVFPVEFDWVMIPAGEFLMGSDKRKDKRAYDDEKPQHTLNLPVYRIARVPVTNAQYKVFIDATKRQGPAHWKGGRIPQGKEEHPVVQVTWQDAMAFCAWAGVRLPSEAEWEKAARGTDGRIFPWGNQDPTKELCNFNRNVDDTTAVGRYPKGASPYGLLDMAGNVWEWTMSLWGTDVQKPDFGYPYRAGDGRENLDAPDSVRRTLRGGSWYVNGNLVRCAYRGRGGPNDRGDYVGFRVVSPGF